MTKHVHIRTPFAKEYKEERKILIQFVKSEENDADITTKNTPNTTFKSHEVKVVWKRVKLQERISKHKSINRKDAKNMLWHNAKETYFVSYTPSCTV